MRRRSFGFRCTELKISIGGVNSTFTDANRRKPSKRRRRPTSCIEYFLITSVQSDVGLDRHSKDRTAFGEESKVYGDLQKMNWEHQHSQRYFVKDGLSIQSRTRLQYRPRPGELGWPEVVCDKILKYFLESVAVDGDAMQNLKAAAVFHYLHSNKIGSVLMHKHDRFVLLKNIMCKYIMYIQLFFISHFLNKISMYII